MASGVKQRRSSILLPPFMSDLLCELNQLVTSLAELFHESRDRQQDIARRLQQSADDIKKAQEPTTFGMVAGAVWGAVGSLFKTSIWSKHSGLIGFVGGGAGVAQAGFAGGGVMAAGGDGTSTTEREERVLTLGNEYMQMLKPLLAILEKIKKVCEDLQGEFSALVASAGEQEARDQLGQVMFQRLQRLVEVIGFCDGVLREMKSLMETVGKLVELVTNNPEQDEHIRAAITESSSKHQQVVDQLTGLVTELKTFQ